MGGTWEHPSFLSNSSPVLKALPNRVADEYARNHYVLSRPFYPAASEGFRQFVDNNPTISTTDVLTFWNLFVPHMHYIGHATLHVESMNCNCRDLMNDCCGVTDEDRKGMEYSIVMMDIDYKQNAISPPTVLWEGLTTDTTTEDFKFMKMDKMLPFDNGRLFGLKINKLPKGGLEALRCMNVRITIAADVVSYDHPSQSC